MYHQRNRSRWVMTVMVTLLALYVGACALFTKSEESAGGPGSIPSSTPDADIESGMLEPPSPPTDSGAESSTADAANARLVSVALGQFACALTEEGTVDCWGWNSGGWLGVGAAALPSTIPPTQVVGLDDAIQISVAPSPPMACARRKTGQVVCWGANTNNSLGDGMDAAAEPIASAPVAVLGLSDAIDISCGGVESCAVRRDGTVACWGYGASTDIDGGMLAQPVAIGGITDAVEVKVGKAHACVRRSDGSVTCWGANESGQCGQPSDGGPASHVTVPASVAGVVGAAQLAAGDATTCARRSDGSVACWGSNAAGALGTTNDAGWTALPTGVSGIQASVELAGSGSTFCSRQNDGSIRCWGSNHAGQLGAGLSPAARQSSTTPVVVAGVQDARALAVGSTETVCALRGNRSVACWGDNQRAIIGGQLFAEIPVQAGTLGQVGPSIDSITAGMFMSCAADGVDVWCWGDNIGGSLGAGIDDTSPHSLTGARSKPVRVAGLPARAKSVVAGDAHACALLEDSTVSCWGGREVNAQGFGDATPTALPIANLPPIAEIASESTDTCARGVDGRVWCWGYAYPGGPTSISGVTALQIATGRGFGCGLVARPGGIVCWGTNFRGALGNGTTQASASPVSVLRVDDAVAVTAGDYHACALRSTGHVACWGYNQYGQLGLGQHDVIDHPFATEVLNLTDAIDVRASQNGTCARHMNGTVVCWGAGTTSGNHTDFSKRTVDAPDQPVDGLVAVALGMGATHACAVAVDRSVRCWGIEGLGQLGDGRTLFYTSPVAVAGF